MRSNSKFEYTPFDQPQPHDREPAFSIYFERQARTGGYSSAVDTFRDAREYPHFLEVAQQLIREKDYARQLPILSGDFQGMIDENGEHLYIDALISARRQLHRENHKRGSRKFILKPAFMIHTVAAQSALDTIATIKLRSKDDIQGYHVIARDGMKDESFFIETNDREFVTSVHNAVVKLCCSGETPHKPEAALRIVLESYASKPPSPHTRNVRFLWRGDHRFKPSMLHMSGDAPIDRHMDKAKPLSWEERAEAFVECKKKARLFADPLEKNEAYTPLTFSFHGYLPSDRVGDPDRRFVDETISAYPGGILMYTRALGSGREDRILRSRSDVIKYKCSVGLKGLERNIEIDTSDKNLANEIHLWILNELRQSDDMRLRQDPLPALKKAIGEWMTPNNPDKTVLITIV